jgi:hypothetical protein
LRQDENKMIISMNNSSSFSLTCMSTCTPMNFDRFIVGRLEDKIELNVTFRSAFIFIYGAERFRAEVRRIKSIFVGI